LISTCLTGYIAGTPRRAFGDTTYGLAVFNEVIRIVIEAYVEPVNGAGHGRSGSRPDRIARRRQLHLNADEFKLYQQGPQTATRRSARYDAPLQVPDGGEHSTGGSREKAGLPRATS
jgi:hypothetical protein